MWSLEDERRRWKALGFSVSDEREIECLRFQVFYEESEPTRRRLIEILRRERRRRDGLESEFGFEREGGSE